MLVLSLLLVLTNNMLTNHTDYDADLRGGDSGYIFMRVSDNCAEVDLVHSSRSVYTGSPVQR